MPELTRTLQITYPTLMRGADVEAAKRAMIRYLDSGPMWKSFVAAPKAVRRTWGLGARALTKKVQAKAGIAQTGMLGPATERELRKAGAFDAAADALLDQYAATLVTICYPHPLGAKSTIGQGLHLTAGLPGNWAFDFMAPGGTPVVAVEAAEIVKISGHPPTYVPDSGVGIFGWNLHYKTPAGYRWFSTHYGSLACRVGQQVKVGQVVAHVGSWPGDPGRSHTHLGVTSPKGWTDAKAKIEAVARAPRVKGTP